MRTRYTGEEKIDGPGIQLACYSACSYTAWLKNPFSLTNYPNLDAAMHRDGRQQQHMLRACPGKKNDTIFTTYGSGSSWSPSRDRYTNASVPKPSMDMSVRSPPKYRA